MFAIAFPRRHNILEIKHYGGSNMNNENPIDYLEFKKEAEKLIEELKKVTTPSPLIICIGNRAYFNLK